MAHSYTLVHLSNATRDNETARRMKATHAGLSVHMLVLQCQHCGDPPLNLAGHTVSAATAQEVGGLYAAPSNTHHSRPALLTWSPSEALQVQVAAAAVASADAADLPAAPVLATAAARAVSVPAAAGTCLHNRKAGRPLTQTRCTGGVELRKQAATSVNAAVAVACNSASDDANQPREIGAG